MSNVREILKSYNLSEYSMLIENSGYEYHMVINEITDDELYIKCRGLIYANSKFLWQRKLNIKKTKSIINMFFTSQNDLVAFKMMN